MRSIIFFIKFCQKLLFLITYLILSDLLKFCFVLGGNILNEVSKKIDELFPLNYIDLEGMILNEINQRNMSKSDK